MNWNVFRPAHGWLRVACAVLVTTSALAVYLLWLSEEHKLAQRRAEISMLSAVHARAIERNLERALSTTYSLAALVRQSRGDVRDFDALAMEMLAAYPGAASLQLAPGGIVGRIVPLAGNEKAVGRDLLQGPTRDQEAIRARDTGRLTLAGPFDLVQGGFAAVGRLPVYLEDGTAKAPFWGFVSVVIRFPEILAPTNLGELVAHGYDYELSRLHPDTGKKQIVAASGTAELQLAVAHRLQVPNAEWTLSLAPRDGWRDWRSLAEKTLLGLLIAAILAALWKALLRLGRQHAELETRVWERTRELAEGENRFRSLFESIENVGVQGYNREHRAIFWNRASEALYGYAKEEALGKTVEELIIPPALHSRFGAAIDDWLGKGVPLAAGEMTMQRRDGSPVPVYCSSTMWVNGRGEPEIYCVDVDLTRRCQAEASMREALVVFNASSQGILTSDATGLITSINPAFSAITGYTAEEVIGRRPSMFKSGRHEADFYTALWAALAAHGRWEGEIWNRRKNGEIYPQWLSISTVQDEQGRIIEYVALFSDITERKQQEELIWRQANFDALTGLANRNLLADRLERALAQARRSEDKVGLVFLDLDGFKWINDTLGHDLGDQLLIEVAQRLKACIREGDTAARLGGDEFTVVIHGLNQVEDMLAIGEKVVSVLREPFILAGATHQITGSVGITIFPDDGEDVQTLLKNADIAMYKAKQAGKNRFQFYARHMQVDTEARMQLEIDLRAALAQNGFALHYQAIVDADSGELVGAEALIRWSHPERSMVSPLDFIPVAEDCGLIVPIGEWVLREAARQWQEWRRCGYPALRISVNVSSVQFREANLSELVTAILNEYQVDPGCLMLEITESVLMDGSPEAEARMHQIKRLGVGYALDDFGTGFSSLSYLKRFPIDLVKIDRGFVNDCPHDRNDAHLVEAIVNMAHSLDLRVTAEGVETDQQVNFLRDLGCDYLQGYRVSRPLPADAFEVLIQHRLLLQVTDGTTLEESRFLAALRQDELDVDEWLRRLLGERSPELATYAAERNWTEHGLDLKQAVKAHLDWRRRLDDFVSSVKSNRELSVEEAGAVDRCTLGRWLVDHRGGKEACFLKLDRVHREFHRLAGQIVSDCAQGQRGLARRTLAGTGFRKISRDVVVALIDCYRSATQTPAGPEEE